MAESLQKPVAAADFLVIVLLAFAECCEFVELSDDLYLGYNHSTVSGILPLLPWKF